MNDWIPSYIENGEADVHCRSCGSDCEFNPTSKVYECDCRFGASAEALAFGLPNYTVRAPSADE